MKLKHARVAKSAISGKMIREIAADEGVSERQVYRILARADVKRVIDDAAAQIVRSAEVILRRGSEGAARALVQMADGTAPADRDRVAAATAVMDRSAGRPLQRTELTGKDGAPFIPTKTAAMDALRAVVAPPVVMTAGEKPPELAAPPAAEVGDAAAPTDPQPR